MQTGGRYDKHIRHEFAFAGTPLATLSFLRRAVIRNALSQLEQTNTRLAGATLIPEA